METFFQVGASSPSRWLSGHRYEQQIAGDLRVRAWFGIIEDICVAILLGTLFSGQCPTGYSQPELKPSMAFVAGGDYYDKVSNKFGLCL